MGKLAKDTEWTEQQVKVCVNDSDDGAILFCYDKKFMKRFAAILARFDMISGPDGMDENIPSIGLYCIDTKEGCRESEENTKHLES
jgi:hypothetical protein